MNESEIDGISRIVSRLDTTEFGLDDRNRRSIELQRPCGDIPLSRPSHPTTGDLSDEIVEAGMALLDDPHLRRADGSAFDADVVAAAKDRGQSLRDSLQTGDPDDVPVGPDPPATQPHIDDPRDPRGLAN